MAANDVPCCESMFWVYLLVCISLVCFAGLMSGLTLGLMSLSLVDLEILAKAGQPQDRKNAGKILPLVKNQHLLLCTLLICNSIAMEALPIFLDALLPAWASVVISVTLILAFGEIIPQAVCSRYGLSVGAKLSFVVRLLKIVTFPLAYPISKVLDWLLGKGHSALLRRAELKMFVDMHGDKAGKGGELTHDETTIIAGALDMTQKTAKDAMTPISDIFCLDINSKLNEETMGLIIRKGHSRVPIYAGSPTNIIGLILVKNLIKCHPEDETPVKDVTIRKIPRVQDCLPLYDILNQFQKGHSHMAVVIKCKTGLNDIEENAKPTTISINVDSDSKQQGNISGSGHQSGQKEQRTMLSNSPTVYSTDNETQSPYPKNMTELQKKSYSQSKKLKQGEDNILKEDWESILSMEDEVVGIITMEDVIEELLQEEILDETDGYVDVHNKISISMVPSRTSLSRSPGAASASQINLRTPVMSPVSSYHPTPVSSCNHTPILHSPITAWSQSPFIRPTLCNSPGDSMPITPSRHSGLFPTSSSPGSKKYEKLKRSSVP
ncbi:DUF21 domain-containing protein At2g14520-like [Rhodamnia argentea]|uniref:DUF21 domain-containing protein At2g14520-like n=1 Tax=Rhodamnia argentea TaxID=178133 RepID=A0A8B8P772_9MYRT|nr:DUF21 domain-containing protein At2g14520-like [Rhodamnia argentea]